MGFDSLDDREGGKDDDISFVVIFELFATHDSFFLKGYQLTECRPGDG